MASVLHFAVGLKPVELLLLVSSILAVSNIGSKTSLSRVVFLKFSESTVDLGRA